MAYTELPARSQDLTFETFEKMFMERFGIAVRKPDTWITLGLYSPEAEFTNAALLLSSQNDFPGIDVVMYGESRDIIRRRVRLENCSVLDLIDDSMKLFEEQFIYEKVEGLYRSVKEKIPTESFREVITNAIVHRQWETPALVKVEFYPDKAIVTSPGGLPEGMSAEEYLSDRHISILRNESLALTFLRLGLIESLGTGIPRIRECYARSIQQPDQQQIYDCVLEHQPVSSTQIQAATGLSRSTLQRCLKSMTESGYLVRTGKGPSSRYIIRHI